MRGKPGGGLTVQIIGDDRVPPLVSIASPQDGLKTKGTTITVSGRASDATTSVASVAINGLPATITGDTFEAKVTLVEGPNIITALATDSVGNQAQASITIIRDTTPPTVTIIDPPNLATFNFSFISVAGQVDDSEASVTVNGIPAVISGGVFNLTLDIGEGTRFNNSKDQFTNPLIKQEYSKAFTDSKPGTETSHEEDGWILRDADGNISFHRWPPGGRKGISPDIFPDSNGQVDGKDVIGGFHTHPTDGGPPSGRDINTTKGLGFDNYVISKDNNIYRIDGKTGTVSDIGDVSDLPGQ